MIVAFLFTPPIIPVTGQSVLGGFPVVDNWFIAAATLFDKVIALILFCPSVFREENVTCLW